MVLSEADVKRFWEKVDRRGEDECWLWQAGCTDAGHALWAPRGLFGAQGKVLLAYRVAWIITHGDIPKGLLVRHNCPGRNNSLCVNPKHLQLGTIRDNNRDAVERDECDDRFKPKLTEEQVIEIRRAYAFNAKSCVQLALEYGVTKPCIQGVVTGQNWSHLPNWKRSEEVKQLAHKARYAKASEIVKEAVPQPTSSRHVPSGLLNNLPRGEAHHRAKLTEEAVIELRERYATGEFSVAALGELYSMHPTTVWDIVRGKFWAHLSNPAKETVEAKSRPRLSSTQIRLIEYAYKEYSQDINKLADAFNVSTSTIRRVVGRIKGGDVIESR